MSAPGNQPNRHPSLLSNFRGAATALATALITAVLVAGGCSRQSADSGLPPTSAPISTTTTAPPVAAVAPGEAPDLTCDGWALSFADNFDGDEIDPARWNVYDSPGHAGNGLRRPEAITVGDGLAIITAREVDGEIVTGGMATIWTQTYGRFEARVRVDPDPNEVTSAVVLTWPASNDWPADGENNIYETGPGADRRPFSSFVHFPDGTELGGQVQFTQYADGTEWHDVALEWGPYDLSIWRDGLRVGHVTDDRIIPDTAHTLTVQLDAMRTAPFEGEVRMEVDWVRIYRTIDPPADCP